MFDHLPLFDEKLRHLELCNIVINHTVYREIRQKFSNSADTNRYMLEVVSFLCVVVVAIVYTQTFYVIPILVKTVLTLAFWFRYTIEPDITYVM